MATRPKYLTILCFSFLLLLINSSHSQRNQLKLGQSTTELASANGIFKLGFRRVALPSSMPLSYLRIYYARAKRTMGYFSSETHLWIGNADSPIIGDTASLEIDSRGSLKIVPHGGSNPVVLYAVEAPTNASATLEDNGNLVLREVDKDGSSRILWQSFYHPTNTFLPGMKLGIDHKTGHNWSLTSWRSDNWDDQNLEPTKGSFTLGVDPDSKDQLVIWWRGNPYWKSGKWPWKDEINAEIQELSSYNFTYVSNENETYFSYSVDVADPFTLFILTEAGDFRDGSLHALASCGYYFRDRAPGCVKLKSEMCKRSSKESPLSCDPGVVTSTGFKFPERDNLNLYDCRNICLLNCSCVAYAPINDDLMGCEIWTSGATFKASNAGRSICHIEEEEVSWWQWVTLAVGGFILLVPLVSMVWMICLRFQEKGDGFWTQKMILRELGNATSGYWKKKAKDHEREGNKLQLFSFEMVAAATDYFSRKNKLGEGGYGPVYKGKLPDGQEIAIKRLSRTSGQGLVEFKNEAILIAKLQHTNLVRLLGLCIQGEEKILIYEYMPNKSLDFFIFDSERSSSLRWEKRFVIIEGIAQGLLYLHKYSRLRVIHRDLKASNILLDNEMNPKISDFGLARIFGVHEAEANTNRVVGTYGYMSPEYAFRGIVSIKTDVFSFGVLLLEIISGKKNNSLYHSEHPLNLIGYAWQLWKGGRALELMDPPMDDVSCPHNEILRCFHVGLLCVQENAKDRPNMLDVISMLSHPSIPIPAPKQPAFFFGAIREEHDILEMNEAACSINQVTMTVMEAR